MDSVRPDHLSLYGYRRKTSPHLDRFSREATVYDFSISPSSFTAAVMPSLFLSLYPTDHYLRFGYPPPIFLRRNTFWFLQLLKTSNVQTAAFTCNFLTSRYGLVGFEEYFDHFDDAIYSPVSEQPFFRSTQDVLPNVISWIEKNKKKNFFLWLHLMDTHGPYVPSVRPLFPVLSYDEDRLLHRIIYSYTGVSLEKQESDSRLQGIPHFQLQGVHVSPNGEIEDFERRESYYVSKYDTAIHVLDSALGNFFSYLRSTDFYRNCQIIVHSDHGEAMGEFGFYFSHGIGITPDQIHVPLLIKDPRIEVGHRSVAVSLLDIVPTILGYFSLPFSQTIRGFDLKDSHRSHELLFSIAPMGISVFVGSRLYCFHCGTVDRNYRTSLKLFKLDPKDEFIKPFQRDQYYLSVYEKVDNLFRRISSKLIPSYLFQTLKSFVDNHNQTFDHFTLDSGRWHQRLRSKHRKQIADLLMRHVKYRHEQSIHHPE